MSLPINKEQKDQGVSFVINTVLGFLPGGHIVGELVDFRAAVQKERLNKFSEYLKEGFENITGKSFEPENLKSEEFIDVFETIMRKVASTGSEEKLKRYCNILLRTMYQKDESEMFFKYVSLIDEISETQILILSSLRRGENLTESEIMRYLSNPDKLHDYMLNLLNKNEFTLFNGQTISAAEVSYFIYDLKSKGIISVVPPEPQQLQGGLQYTPKEVYKISPIGDKYLEFIQEFGKSE